MSDIPNSECWHVYPINDLREHDTNHGLDCWCRPFRDPEDPYVIVHRAADRREVFEEAGVQ